MAFILCFKGFLHIAANVPWLDVRAARKNFYPVKPLRSLEKVSIVGITTVLPT